MNSLLKFIFWVALTLFIIAMVTLSISCSSLRYKPPAKTNDIPDVIINTIYKTDWLTSIFLLSIVLSIFIGLNGVKAGWLGAAAAFCGLLLKMAITNTWLWIAAGIFFLVIAGIAVFTVFVKSRALKEIIIGVQKIKTQNHVYNDNNGYAQLNTVGVNKTLASTQSKSTKQIVKKVKEKL